MCWCYLGQRHVQGASFGVIPVYPGKAARVERGRAGVGPWLRGAYAGIAISFARKTIRMVARGFKTFIPLWDNAVPRVPFAGSALTLTFQYSWFNRALRPWAWMSLGPKLTPAEFLCSKFKQSAGCLESSFGASHPVSMIYDKGEYCSQTWLCSKQGASERMGLRRSPNGLMILINVLLLRAYEWLDNSYFQGQNLIFFFCLASYQSK